MQISSGAAHLELVLAGETIFPILGFPLTTENTIKLDLSTDNLEMADIDLTDTGLFQLYINKIRNNCQFGVGGYAENRFMYKRSSVFDHGGKSRSLHLGLDIWGEAYTPVYTPITGKVHSFAFNDRYGDYGATIILEHEINGQRFHTLYGHLSLSSIADLAIGKNFEAGEKLCFFGEPLENGHWPPHLHFQVIMDMQGKTGDYPGVAPRDEADFYLNNCPDPNIIIQTAVL